LQYGPKIPPEAVVIAPLLLQLVAFEFVQTGPNIPPLELPMVPLALQFKAAKL